MLAGTWLANVGADVQVQEILPCSLLTIEACDDDDGLQ